MFDNVPKPTQPQQPADMFDGIDRVPTLQAPRQAPGSTIAPPPSALPPMSPVAPPPTPSHGGGMGIGKTIVIILLAVLVLGGSGYLAYVLMSQPAEEGSVVNAVDDDGVGDGGYEEIEGEGIEEDAEEEGAEDEEGVVDDENDDHDASAGSFLDSDGDGLTNAEELEAGTSVTKADTDGDGLGDREEVEVYDTDPKDVDTDDDTYLDGQEVAGGYNPNGAGRLFSVPE